MFTNSASWCLGVNSYHYHIDDTCSLSGVYTIIHARRKTVRHGVHVRRTCMIV